MDEQLAGLLHPNPTAIHQEFANEMEEAQRQMAIHTAAGVGMMGTGSAMMAYPPTTVPGAIMGLGGLAQYGLAVPHVIEGFNKARATGMWKNSGLSDYVPKTPAEEQALFNMQQQIRSRR